MKQLTRIFMLLAFMGIATGAAAQPVVSPTIVNGYNPYYSRPDTITNTQADTIYAEISGTKASVGFNFVLNKIAGRLDSFTVAIYANKLLSASGPWAHLTTLTSTNASGLLDYTINSGVGNPFTNFMFVFSSNNLVSSQASWQAYCLIR